MSTNGHNNRLIRSAADRRLPQVVTRKEWTAFLQTLMERDAVMAATIDRLVADVDALTKRLDEHGLYVKPDAE